MVMMHYYLRPYHHVIMAKGFINVWNTCKVGTLYFV
jgi:hypothetical protein